MRVSLLLCLIALGAMAVSAQVNCAQYNNCDSCTATYPCGWCSLTNNCQTGNATGSPTCTAPYWTWLKQNCGYVPTPAPAQVNCAQYSNCDSCTATYPCGWCSLTNNCQTGNATGSPTCSAPYWTWLESQCNVAPTPVPQPTYSCPMYDNCGQCTVLPGCGFCSLTGTCVPGTQTQSYWGNCSGSNWAWVNSQCSVVPTPAPAPPTPTYSCPMYDNCAQCTVLPGCGFCSLTGTCVPGSQTQSYWGNCSGSNWAWVNYQCNVLPTPAPPSPPSPSSACPASLSCQQCTTLQGCGFCTTTGCQAGNITGSYAGCSGSWEFVTTQCTESYAPATTPTPPTVPPTPTSSCPTTFSCQKCTLLEGCEYCSTTGCMSQNGSCSGNIIMNFTGCS